MSISTVEAAIRHARTMITEWEEEGFGFGDWLEVHTRYAVIDPVITALGWDTSDPKECHPEYPRYGDGETRARVDYALFGEPNLVAIGNYEVAPDVIIEAKSVGVELEEHVEQLEGYAEAAHRMRNGVAVLTNGREWWLYDLDRRGSFHGKRLAPINALEDNLRESARTLNAWLDRRRFG
jgi:hypothetical protein